MRVTGVQRLPVGAARLRAVLEEPERLARALPHVDDLVALDDQGAFEATIRPALALGEVPFRTVWRRAPGAPDGVLSYDVDGRHEEHVLELHADVRLDGDGERVVVAWDVDCGFTGTMRAVGQRVLPAIVRQQIALVLAAAAREAEAP